MNAFHSFALSTSLVATLPFSAYGDQTANESVFVHTGSDRLTLEESDAASSQTNPLRLVATFAGGCFWCTEAVFERVKGVQNVVSGYTGGDLPNPSYNQVKSMQTGHAEAVEISFDPTVVSYEELLEIFFKIHDPTTLNAQGVDEGPQYRSAVFFHDDQQQATATRVIQRLADEGAFDHPIVTEVVPITAFYVAEEYHQNFFRRNPRQSYCRRVVVKKVRKFKNVFPENIQRAK